MQFKVPQFLDIEDTIFGPFTFKEFVYLAGGGGVCFIIYKLVGFLWGFIPMLLVAGFSVALTFYRPNGKPFIKMLEAGFNYYTQDKLFIWKKHKNKSIKNETGLIKLDESSQNTGSAKLSGNKLRDLAWSLDVLDLKKEGKRN